MKIQKKCSRPYKIRVCPRLQSGGNSLFLSGSLISHRTAAEMRLKPAYNTDESITGSPCYSGINLNSGLNTAL